MKALNRTTAKLSHWSPLNITVEPSHGRTKVDDGVVAEYGSLDSLGEGKRRWWCAATSILLFSCHLLALFLFSVRWKPRATIPPPIHSSLILFAYRLYFLFFFWNFFGNLILTEKIVRFEAFTTNLIFTLLSENNFLNMEACKVLSDPSLGKWHELFSHVE